MQLVAGVDSSTGSTKVEVRDLHTGAIHSAGSASHPATSPPRSEQDPAAWWRAFGSAWAAAGEPDVAAISVAAQQHGMIVIDEAGDVVRPAKLWNDTESAADASWLLQQLDGGAAAWVAATGNLPAAAFTISKLSWLHRTEPDSWSRLAKVVLPHDWLTARLTDAPVESITTDRGDASGTGYWSATTGEYCWDVLAMVDRDRDWSRAVPKVLAALEPAGTWGRVAVAAGTGDNMAAALGLGVGPGDVVISLGTSGTVFAVADHPCVDPTGTVAGFADATGRHLPLVCTMNATKVTDAVARLLGVGHAAFDELALAAPVGAGGLILLPYLDGERTPSRPGATGTLIGLRSGVSREDLARAAIEGVVCGLLDGLDALRAHLSDCRRVIMVGGGAKSVAAQRVLADLCDLPVVVSNAREAVATGACVQAAATLEQRSHSEIIERWGLGDGTQVPQSSAGGGVSERVRAAYAELRDRTL